MIGESKEFHNSLNKISKLAPIDRPLLVIGERGTGKELVGERIHYLSKRWDRPFIKLNCAALSDELLESELFGHERGAFTGAIASRLGRFELAHRGTLFLDEIANTTKRLQEKILRVVEYGEFERVGSEKTRYANVRIVAATNKNLKDLVKNGLFKADLLDRLSFDVIILPPLRYRTGDVELLSNHFALKMVAELKEEFFTGFSKNALKDLCAYNWPGNIRELKNVIERSIAINHPLEKKIDEIIFDPFMSPYKQIEEKVETNKNTILKENTVVKEKFSIEGKFSFEDKVENYKFNLLKNALEENKFNQKKTADYMNLSYNQIRGMIRKYDKDLEKF